MTTLNMSVRERGHRRAVNGDSVTVVVNGELDIATVPRFTARMGELIRRGSFRELVLDLSGITFIDVGGVRALAEVRRRVEQRDATLVLAGVPPQMTRLMQIIGPTRQFRLK